MYHQCTSRRETRQRLAFLSETTLLVNVSQYKRSSNSCCLPYFHSCFNSVTHISCSKTFFFENLVIYVIMQKKYSKAEQVTDAIMEHAGFFWVINALNPELNPICYLLALLAHHFLHVSRIRVKSLTLRLLMSYIYIYGAPIIDVFRSHTTTQHSR